MPRNFAWIVKDRLAVSERPGGYAPHHRRVRRQEEILWLEAQGFTRVVSLLPSSHNLHAYEELGLPASHVGLPPHADVRDELDVLYPALLGWIRDGERVLVHQEELGERVAGVVAGFLCWCGLLPDPTRAIYAVEQLLRRQLGSSGRAIVALAPTLRPPSSPRRTDGEPAPAPGDGKADPALVDGTGSPAVEHASAGAGPDALVALAIPPVPHSGVPPVDDAEVAGPPPPRRHRRREEAPPPPGKR
ncbi:MAG TPA: hypothetical protein VND23_12205 [Acidimicrobiales bacterium]|nr:hypothetical protein [Acidimicrobiales bacterium]